MPVSLTSRIEAFLEKPIMAAVFFLGGVIWDTATLTRIDRVRDNLILLLYLLALGCLIVVSARADLRASLHPQVGTEGQLPWPERVRPYYRRVIQFLLGGQFSAYAVFYFKSASLTSTGAFFVLLVGLLVTNEFFHQRIASVRLLIGLYSLVSLSFFTFFLPVVTKIMNTWMFLLGAGLSVAITLTLVRLIYRPASGIGWRERILPGLSGLMLIGLVVGFYFLNLIPPVPLSLRFGGAYHQVTREGEAYQLVFEREAWYRFWQRSDDPYRGGGPVYCFTAVFAPVDLHTKIYHRWQFRPPEGQGTRAYTTTDRIGFPIAGGRDDGYRGYTVKQAVMPGDWRVDVETSEGHILGRVQFRVERASAEPSVPKTIVY